MSEGWEPYDLGDPIPETPEEAAGRVVEELFKKHGKALLKELRELGKKASDRGEER